MTSEFEDDTRGRCTLRFWSDHNCRIVGKDSRAPLTYTLMTGGKGSVPPELYDRFLQAYAADVADNVQDPSLKLCITEIATPIHRLYMDFDLKTKERFVDFYSQHMVEFLLLPVQKVVKTFFPTAREHELWSIVAVGGERMEPDGTWKYGIHAYWADLFLTHEQSLDIRQSTLYALQVSSLFLFFCMSRTARQIDLLQEKHGEQPAILKNSLKDVVDANIYSSAGGLRMLGAYKAQRCKECQKQRTRGCAHCHGGYQYGKIRYMVTTVLDSEGQPVVQETQRLQADVLYALRRTCLRSPERTESSASFARPEGAPPYLPAGAVEKNKKRKQPASAGPPARPYARTAELPPDGAAVMKAWRGDLLPADHPAVLELQVYLNQQVNMPAYNRTHIKDVLKRPTAKGHDYLVHVQGAGSGFCYNVGRDHNNHGVYFYIDQFSFYQRCFCRCNELEGRRSGKLCKEYISEPFPLTQRLRSLLFPNSSTLNTDIGLKSSYDENFHRQQDHLITVLEEELFIAPKAIRRGASLVSYSKLRTGVTAAS